MGGPEDAPPPAPAESLSSELARFDLTAQLGTYLDRHLVFPLLEFLQVQGVYPEAEILQAKIDLLQKTNMVDFAMDIHASLHGDAPCPELVERRAVVVARLKELQGSAEKVVSFLSGPEVKKLRSDKQYNLEMLKAEHQARAPPVTHPSRRPALLGLSRRRRAAAAGSRPLTPPRPDWGGGY